MKKRVALLLAALLVLSLLLPLSAAAAPLPFEDVAEGAWYYADVEQAYASGLFVGVSATSFNPAGTLTLSQSVTLAARVAQTLDIGRVTLENGSPVWYSTYVDYAKARGIIGDEYDARWSEPATRYEMVQIFYAIPGVDLTQRNRIDDDAVPDVRADDACAPAVYAFYRAGILTGSSGNLFLGDDPIARREVAAILNRLLHPDSRKQLTLLSDAAGDTPEPEPEPEPAPEITLTQSTELTMESLLALLDAYDPDGAWIIRHAEEAGQGGWRVWAWGASTLGDLDSSLETIVHEQLHAYTHLAGWRSEYIYIGDGESVLVPYTDVFDTAEAADLFPESLRTFRYDDYVSSNAEPLMASRQFGVYGLLNEYAAYCWGMNNYLKLSSFFDNYKGWGSNVYISFTEFRFYILSYMLYAREQYPAVYQGIMDNSAFLRAFSAVDTQFELETAQYRTMLPLYFDDEYLVLLDALAAPEYQEMLALMKS